MIRQSQFVVNRSTSTKMGCCLGKEKEPDTDNGGPQGTWAYGRGESVVRKSEFDKQYDADENIAMSPN